MLKLEEKENRREKKEMIKAFKNNNEEGEDAESKAHGTIKHLSPGKEDHSNYL